MCYGYLCAQGRLNGPIDEKTLRYAHTEVRTQLIVSDLWSNALPIRQQMRMLGVFIFVEICAYKLYWNSQLYNVKKNKIHI